MTVAQYALISLDRDTDFPKSFETRPASHIVRQVKGGIKTDRGFLRGCGVLNSQIKI